MKFLYRISRVSSDNIRDRSITNETSSISTVIDGWFIFRRE